MTKKTFLAVIFFVAVISVMIFTGVGASLWGVELHSLELEIADVEAVNRELEDKIIMHSSLTAIQESSQNYVMPEQLVSLNGESWFLGYAR